MSQSKKAVVAATAKNRRLGLVLNPEGKHSAILRINNLSVSYNVRAKD